MYSNKRLIVSAAALVFTLIVLWAGASVYVGKLLEAEFQKVVQASVQSHSYRLRNLKHQGGLFASSGQADLALIDECGAIGRAPEYFKARLSYKLSHLILPTSLARIEWSLEPSGEAKADFEKLFNGQARLEGKGKIGISGTLQSDMSLPEIKWGQSGTVVSVSPSAGTITIGKGTLDVDWKTAKITGRGHGSAMQLDGLGMQVGLSNMQRGLGSVTLTVDKIATSLGSAEGIQLATEVLEQGDHLNMMITPSIKSVSGGGKEFKDLMLQIAVNGLHGKSIEYLLNLSQTSCNFHNLTKKEAEQMRDSVRTLLFEGFSAGIQKIGGIVDGDTLDARLMVELVKTTGTEFKLVSVLKSRGQLTLLGKDNQDTQQDHRNSLVTMGIGTKIPGGVKAEYDYDAGLMKLNGAVFDAVLLESIMSGMDKAINAFLRGEVVTELAPSSPPKEAPPEEAQPEEAERPVVEA